MHVDPRQVDLIGVETADRHDLLDLGHADLATGGGRRIEVAGRLAEDEIA